ncbi:hypothetical protein GCM10027162_61440 [Streptomyces incanus]
MGGAGLVCGDPGGFGGGFGSFVQEADGVRCDACCVAERIHEFSSDRCIHRGGNGMRIVPEGRRPTQWLA